MSPSTKRKWQRSCESTNSDPSPRLKPQSLSAMVETRHNGQGWLKKSLPSGVLKGSMAGIPTHRRKNRKNHARTTRRRGHTGNSSLSVAEMR